MKTQLSISKLIIRTLKMDYIKMLKHAYINL